jgi:tetratricopeptide (TPR) repeat protein
MVPMSLDPLLIPDWSGARIASLPIADRPQDLVKFVWALSNRPASLEQKQFTLRLAQYAYNKMPNDKIAALAVSHAAFILADDEDSSGKKLDAAEIGVKAAEGAGYNDKEKDPVAAYYYAVNLGIIVQIKGLFALGKLPDIVEALKIAVKTPDTDMGGPLRTIGMLYLKAPAWPQGIGDIDLALENLEKAAKEYPMQPQNSFFYAAALIENDNKVEARGYLETAKKMAVPEIWGTWYAKKWIDEIRTYRKKAAD